MSSIPPANSTNGTSAAAAANGQGAGADQFREDGGAQPQGTPTKAAPANQFNAILERIAALENLQKQQYESMAKSAADQLAKMQNDQREIMQRIGQLEKQQQKTVLLKFLRNGWDKFACHNDLEIVGDKSLTVRHTGRKTRHTVFAKHPILLNNNSPDIFYFEISVRNKKSFISFGFSDKQLKQLVDSVHRRTDTYAYENDGEFWINGSETGENAQFSYGVGDVVGIGVNLADRQVIFTKNGRRLDSSDSFVAPFAVAQLFPFVSLYDFGDKIEANFGPDFTFNLATLC